MTDDKEYKYTGPGPVTPEEVVEGAHVSQDVIDWLNDNWDKIPERRKPFFAGIGRIAFDEGYLEYMRQQGRL